MGEERLPSAAHELTAHRRDNDVCGDASVHDFDWIEAANALLNVCGAKSLAARRLEIELDPADLKQVPPHAVTAR